MNLKTTVNVPLYNGRNVNNYIQNVILIYST